jgi:hypothetical protein
MWRVLSMPLVFELQGATFRWAMAERSLLSLWLDLSGLQIGLLQCRLPCSSQKVASSRPRGYKHWTGAMQDPECVLRRTPLLRRWVNKGMKKGRHAQEVV